MLTVLIYTDRPGRVFSSVYAERFYFEVTVLSHKMSVVEEVDINSQSKDGSIQDQGIEFFLAIYHAFEKDLFIDSNQVLGVDTLNGASF